MDNDQYDRVLKQYNYISQLAKRGQSTKEDWLVLTSDSDPFNCGTPGRIKLGEWFGALWETHGKQDMHLRRFHYTLVSQPTPPLLPNGQPYQNTEACWDILNSGSRNARYLGLVDPLNLKEHRSEEAILNVIHRGGTPRPFISGVFAGLSWRLPTVDQGHHVGIVGPQVLGYDYHTGDQPYHIEVWVEKSGVDDVLEPVCSQLGVNLMVGVGYISVTRIVELMERIKASNKPARLFYISDFDPSGENMPSQVGCQIEFWNMARYSLKHDIKVKPLVLTAEQVKHYQLPRTPLKDSDLGKEGFEDKHGAGATELDALEALHPGELRRVVRAAIEPYQDHTLSRRLSAASSKAAEDLRAEWKAASAEVQTQVDVIGEQIATIAAKHTEQLAADLAPLEAALEEQREVLAEVKNTFTTKVELPPRPEPEVTLPDESEVLFDSNRSYEEQRQGKLKLKREQTAEQKAAKLTRQAEKALAKAAKLRQE